MHTANVLVATPARAAAALVLWIACAAGASAAPDSSLKGKILAAFAAVKSYKLTVLGSVRSLGVWQAPDRYQMTTEFDGKAVKTIIVGQDLYEYQDGKWEKTGTASSNLDVDIAGLVRTLSHDPRSQLVPQSDQTQDGKRVGTFSYTFKGNGSEDGTEETCNYDKTSYLITRCKTEDLTLLYSAYNDPTNKVASIK